MDSLQQTNELVQEENDKVDMNLPEQIPTRPSVKERRRSTTAELKLMNLQNAVLQQVRLERDGPPKEDKINFRCHGKKLLFADRSLFILTPENPVRRAMVWIHEWKYFDVFITVCILLNTVILMFQDYRFRIDKKYENNWRNQMIQISEYIFGAIFIMEFLIKVIGMGFLLEPGTYLRDWWNVLDFIVVISSILGFFPTGVTNFSAIRTLRMLRPLRSINSVKGMKVLVTSLIDSLPDLGNVVIFLMFIMILFAILGLQLFSGVFENRCRMTEKPVDGQWVADPDITRLCTLGDKSSCPSNRWCGSPFEEKMRFDSDELYLPAFNYGYTKFDNLFQALFTIFQSLTTEGWTNIVFLLSDAYTPVIVYLYFTILVLVGSFFVVNLILAVINESFVKNDKKINEGKDSDDNSENNTSRISQQDEIEPQRINTQNSNTEQNNTDNKSQISSSVPQAYKQRSGIQKIVPLNELPTRKLTPIKKLADDDSEVQEQSQMKHRQQPNLITSIPENGAQELLNENLETENQPVQKKKKNSTYELDPNQVKIQDQKSEDQNNNNNYSGSALIQGTQNKRNVSQQDYETYKITDPHADNKVNEEKKQEGEPNPFKGLVGITLFRKKIEIFIDEPFFITLTTVFILANTITLSLDMYPMDKDYENGLEIANLIFTISFALEMVIKLTGLGFRGYVRDSFNIFDGLIVILSLIEIILSNANTTDVSGGGFAAISAFRSLRLFRIFKLARSWENLRSLLMAMGQTLAQISNFSVLVMLFMTVSSLLGMEFFAYKIRFNDEDRLANPLKDGTSPRVNYDSFLSGIIAVFVLLTNEDWNAVLYDHMRGMNSWVPVIYFVAVVVIGNFILLSLFLAILIYNFGEASEETKKKIQQETLERQKQKKTGIKKEKNKLEIFIDRIKKLFNIQTSEETENNKMQSQRSHCNDEELNETQKNNKQIAGILKQTSIPLSVKNRGVNSPISKKSSPPNGQKKFQFENNVNNNSSTNQTPNQLRYMKSQSAADEDKANTVLQDKETADMDSLGHNNSNHVNNNLSPHPEINENASQFIRPNFQLEQQLQQKNLSKQLMQQSSGGNKSDLLESVAINYNLQQQQKQNIAERPPLEGVALFFMNTEQKFRLTMYNMCGQNWFEWSVIGLILFSSVILVLDDPQEDPDSVFKQVLYWIDFVVTILFVIECVVKIISYGFLINGPHSYLRSLSNCLDFLIVIFSVFGLFQTGSGGSNLDKLKILRILRVLRPLRLISRNEELKLAINSLIRSIPSMLNLLVVCLIFFLLFGIFGVNYFKGSFFYCDIDMEQKLIKTKTECYDFGGDWVNKSFNFDNILQAMINLFVLSTTEGWVSMMWDGVDSVGIDKNPQRDANRTWALFYILFILVGGFFIINLFAGIVVDSFNTTKDKLSGLSFLSREQQEWIDIQTRILDLQPERQIVSHTESHKTTEGYSFWRILLYDFVTHKAFDPFILISIITNTIVFMLVWHRQPDEMVDTIKIINYIFLAIFTLEAIFKIISFGKLYFSDPWNNFDFVVVILTIVGVILESANVIENIGSATSIIRTFRIARVLKLIKRAKSLRMIFATFIVTLPALANIAGLLFLVLFLYSVLGMNLFSFIWQSSDGLTNKANFIGFFRSFFTLFKCSTGESWNLILADLVRTKEPNHPCNIITNYDSFRKYGITGCGGIEGYLFLISFQILFAMIVLNLFIAVILEGFDKTLKNEESHLKPLEISDFLDAWKIYDPKATGFMKASKLKDFMEELNEPKGFKDLTVLTQEQKNIRMAHLHIPIYHNIKPIKGAVKAKIPHYFFYEVFEALAKDAMLLDYQIQKIIPQQEKPVIAIQKLEKNKQKITKRVIRYFQKTEFNSSDFVCCEYVIKVLLNIINTNKTKRQDTIPNERNQQNDNNNNGNPSPYSSQQQLHQKANSNFSQPQNEEKSEKVENKAISPAPSQHESSSRKFEIGDTSIKSSPKQNRMQKKIDISSHRQSVQNSQDNSVVAQDL